MFLISPHKGFHGQGLYELVGSFAPNAAAAIDQTLNRSGTGVGVKCGFSVAHSGSTGIYNVTLSEPVAELVSLDAWLTKGAGSTADSVTDAGTPGNQGRLLQIGTYTAGVAANLAAAAGKRVNFRAVVRLSRGQLPGVRGGYSAYYLDSYHPLTSPRPDGYAADQLR